MSADDHWCACESPTRATRVPPRTPTTQLRAAVASAWQSSHVGSTSYAAVIVDGAVRDAAQLGELPIGIWARGITPSGPYKDGPGEIGYPVACGGQVVMPGDLIAADEDGVVVIPRTEAAAVIEAAEAHAAKEAETTAAIRGAGWPRGWVEETLAAKGVTVTR